MKIIYRNMKTGTLKLKTESPEDPWHLARVLEVGDHVTAKTDRRKTFKRGSEIVRGERVQVTLTIELERSVLEAGKLRVRGRILSGPKDIELASYHSILIEPYMVVTVRKEQWRRDQLERLKRAAVKEPLLFICVLDREQADFASLKETGLDFLGSVRAAKVLGKEDDRSEYYAEIAKLLLDEAETHSAIIVAGPGFEKENLLNYAKDKFPKLVRHISLENASHGGHAGIQEVIKTSANRILKQTRVAKETEMVETMLEYIGKGGLVTYGRNHVQAAALQGAVETMLVSEEMVPDNEGLMNSVEQMSGKVFIITSNHEAGERFLYLGGVGAFLRYKPEED
jgi:protein pelota